MKSELGSLEYWFINKEHTTICSLRCAGEASVQELMLSEIELVGTSF